MMPAIVFQIPSPSIDGNRLLEAIRQVENWNGRMGAAGERGVFQITPEAWAEATSMPFEWADDPHTSAQVALFILNRRKAELIHRGEEVTVWSLA